MIKIRRFLNAVLASGLDWLSAVRHQVVSLALFALIAVGGGFTATWLLAVRGTALTTEQRGHWTIWPAAGRSDADPYTRAHFVRHAIVPISGSIVHRFEAREDSEGRALHSSCEYVIEGPEPTAFWSLAVFGSRGRMVRNDANRFSFNADTALIARPGVITIHLARNARPGNWLPTGGAGRLVVVFQVEAQSGASGAEASQLPEPPTVRRVSC